MVSDIGGRLVDKPSRLSERVSVLETSVEGLHSDLAEVKTSLIEGFKEIQHTLSGSAKTNWGTVIAGIALLMGVWAAAIRPLAADIEKEQGAALILASSVVEQNRQLTDLRVLTARQGEAIISLRVDVEDLKIHGAPSVDRRLSVIETKLNLAKNP